MINQSSSTSMMSKSVGKMDVCAGKSRPTWHIPGHSFFIHFSGIFEAKVSYYDILSRTEDRRSEPHIAHLSPRTVRSHLANLPSDAASSSSANAPSAFLSSSGVGLRDDDDGSDSGISQRSHGWHGCREIWSIHHSGFPSHMLVIDVRSNSSWHSAVKQATCARRPQNRRL